MVDAAAEQRAVLAAAAGELTTRGASALSALRSAVAAVPQDTALMSDTLAANIAYGRMRRNGEEGDEKANNLVSAEEIEAAARAAGLAPVVAAMPLGLGTLVGERGLRRGETDAGSRRRRERHGRQEGEPMPAPRRPPRRPG